MSNSIKGLFDYEYTNNEGRDPRSLFVEKVYWNLRKRGFKIVG